VDGAYQMPSRANVAQSHRYGLGAVVKPMCFTTVLLPTAVSFVKAM
jgi:hypothetical protein